ncbi:hypothetical protein CBI57_06870 [Pantoea agglomerans]|nr:hypothetical protein CBI57_06870 [Pantoea agglomerans]
MAAFNSSVLASLRAEKKFRHVTFLLNQAKETTTHWRLKVNGCGLMAAVTAIRMAKKCLMWFAMSTTAVSVAKLSVVKQLQRLLEVSGIEVVRYGVRVMTTVYGDGFAMHATKRKRLTSVLRRWQE